MFVVHGLLIDALQTKGKQNEGSKTLLANFIILQIWMKIGHLELKVEEA